MLTDVSVSEGGGGNVGRGLDVNAHVHVPTYCTYVYVLYVYVSMYTHVPFPSHLIPFPARESNQLLSIYDFLTLFLPAIRSVYSLMYFQPALLYQMRVCSAIAPTRSLSQDVKLPPPQLSPPSNLNG
jgi:hypothetical protein